MRQAERSPITWHINVHNAGRMIPLETVNGVVIREKQIGESDKALAVLTREIGLIEVMAKGAMKINSKLSGSTQLFMYSKLCLNKSKDRFYLNSCEPLDLFYNIRLDMCKYALACYFADIIHYTIQLNEPCDIITRLLLNTLYFLDNGKVSNRTLKTIFEFRHICEIGMMPQLLCCRRCYRYSTDIGLNMYMDMKDSTLLCEDCKNELAKAPEPLPDMIKLSPKTVEQLRYIALSEYKHLYKIKLNSDEETVLSDITENYLQEKLGVVFRSLNFYKSIEFKEKEHG